MSDYAHRIMGLYNPYDEALFSDYQDHLAEEAYHNHCAMQEEAKVTGPSPLFRIRAYLADQLRRVVAWLEPGCPF